MIWVAVNFMQISLRLDEKKAVFGAVRACFLKTAEVLNRMFAAKDAGQFNCFGQTFWLSKYKKGFTKKEKRVSSEKR